MEIEKIIKVSEMYDYYSDLLSDKQKQYIHNYYFDDLSLSELSEIHGVSKQAISNNIKRTILELEYFEEKLKIIQKTNERLFLLSEIRKLNNNKEIDILLEQLINLDI